MQKIGITFLKIFLMSLFSLDFILNKESIAKGIKNKNVTNKKRDPRVVAHMLDIKAKLPIAIKKMQNLLADLS